jgi:hypothetical protein
MLKNQLLSSIFLLFVAACGNTVAVKETAKTQTETAPAPPIVGNDSDEHGCKGSAGFQWSVVKNECIQIFNTGIRLNPKAKNLDQTTSAFVVFKSDDDDAQAELFIPSSKASIILQKEGKDNAGTWKNADYILTQWKGMYSVEDNKKTLLYQGAK